MVYVALVLVLTGILIVVGICAYVWHCAGWIVRME